MRLRERLADISEKNVVSTIINYEEQIRGWMAYIAKAKTISEQVVGYQRLRRHLENFRHTPVVDFDDIAAYHCQKLRDAPVRIGTMDLKIAAITISLGAILLSRNLLDFERVPGLQVEDWTQ